MRFAVKPRAEIEAEARDQYKAAVASAPPPDLRNAQAVAQLDEALRFDFREVRFQAGPTPYAEGVALLALQTRLQALDGRGDPQALEEYGHLLEDAAERFHRLARPERLRDRIRWLGRNPFRVATEAEIGWLVGFFSSCRMIARVRHGKRS